ncbi:hypothetical protein LZ30DRAFT_277572 [Colletotrichum cereale]|nr:hypothetical protein LZ30DRAFT_277572 [Colletotrichum cereale]
MRHRPHYGASIQAHSLTLSRHMVGRGVTDWTEYATATGSPQTFDWLGGATKHKRASSSAGQSRVRDSGWGPERKESRAGDDDDDDGLESMKQETRERKTKERKRDGRTKGVRKESTKGPAVEGTEGTEQKLPVRTLAHLGWCLDPSVNLALQSCPPRQSTTG